MFGMLSRYENSSVLTNCLSPLRQNNNDTTDQNYLVYMFVAI